MTQIVKWLRTILSRPEASTVERADEAPAVEDLVMPDIYAVEHVDTVPVLKIIDLSSPDIDKTTGFNPYDTAVLRKK